MASISDASRGGQNVASIGETLVLQQPFTDLLFRQMDTCNSSFLSCRSFSMTSLFFGDFLVEIAEYWLS